MATATPIRKYLIGDDLQFRGLVCGHHGGKHGDTDSSHGAGK